MKQTEHYALNLPENADTYNVKDYNENFEILDTQVAAKQTALTAGENIQIEEDIISATDTKYTAGENVTISDDNEISVHLTDWVDMTSGDIEDFFTINWQSESYYAGQISQWEWDVAPILQALEDGLYRFELIGEWGTNQQEVGEITGTSDLIYFHRLKIVRIYNGQFNVTGLLTSGGLSESISMPNQTYIYKTPTSQKCKWVAAAYKIEKIATVWS